MYYLNKGLIRTSCSPWKLITELDLRHHKPIIANCPCHPIYIYMIEKHSCILWFHCFPRGEKIFFFVYRSNNFLSSWVIFLCITVAGKRKLGLIKWVSLTSTGTRHRWIHIKHMGSRPSVLQYCISINEYLIHTYFNIARIYLSTTLCSTTLWFY